MAKLINELAGILCLDPSPFTLRDLAQMASSKLSHTWEQASYIAAMLLSAFSPKPISPDKINPYLLSQQRGTHSANHGEAKIKTAELAKMMQARDRRTNHGAIGKRN